MPHGNLPYRFSKNLLFKLGLSKDVLRGRKNNPFLHHPYVMTVLFSLCLSLTLPCHAQKKPTHFHSVIFSPSCYQRLLPLLSFFRRNTERVLPGVFNSAKPKHTVPPNLRPCSRETINHNTLQPFYMTRQGIKLLSSSALAVSSLLF